MGAEVAGEREYLHGYSRAEQERLVAQAEYFRTSLIPRGLDYRAGERVLEIGCGAGAVLGILAQTFPGLRLAGLDREPAQIGFAREHLRRSGVADAELAVGDAAQLPWPDGSFDHVFAMWFLEHVREPGPILAEARRVLRPGGSIALTETDYELCVVHPSSPDVEALFRAQHEHFARHGQPHAGRELGAWLAASGFTAVTNEIAGFHFFAGSAADTERLRVHALYNVGFLEPAVEPMVHALGADERALRRGIEHLRRLADQPGAAMTQIVFRSRGRRPGA
jgi:ubiquinone/menaquinone biosynthesis C-methylase UbiE